MKRFALLLLSVLMFVSLSCPEMDAAAKSKRKKGKKAQVEQKAEPKKKVSKYEKTFINDKSCVTARCEGGFMTLHKAKGKLYIELPLSSLDREMLIASTVSDCSAADVATIGYKEEAPLHVKFQKADSTILLTMVNVLPDFDKDDPAMRKAVEVSKVDPVLSSWSMTCWNPDSTAVVFDATSMFVGDNKELALVKSGSAGGGLSVTANFNKDGSYLKEIKAFKDNVTIKSVMSYKLKATVLGLLTLYSDKPFTGTATRTIMLLPEEKMRPRIADSRLGIFLTDRTDMYTGQDAMKDYSVIRRWNLQPSDMEAWQSGELVEPVKPVVFYIDDALPELWREPAKRGVLRWNKAFEQLGFKNAVQVRDFPKDDPEFDPDNLKYSCVRYVPTPTANAMGPSWFDPTTGEIINASVLVYSDVIRLINNWRFTQTSQVDPRVRSKRMPDDIVQESMEYVIAHEVGHCLGFMHNMSASASFPVDSLRSSTFTRKYGTTPSIMDYARFNYIAQPGDEGVRLTPPDLGEYDHFLVKYAYSIIPEATDMKSEAAVLESWVDEKAGDPIYRYGRQQTRHRYDPSAIEEDLGDDPIRASDYGIANLKYILSHFNEWMPDEADPDASLKKTRYSALVSQYSRYIRAVMMNIGGIYLTEVKPGTSGENIVSVPGSVQKKSLKWVLDQIRNCTWMDDESVTGTFSLRTDMSPAIQYNLALDLFETSENVVLSSSVAEQDDAYTLRNWLDDMYAEIWKSTISGKTPSRCDRFLQNLYVAYLAPKAIKKTSMTSASTSVSISGDSPYLPSVDHMVDFGLDQYGVLAEHLDYFRSLEDTNGVGYVASQIMLDEFGPSGYGFQKVVNVKAIDETRSLFYGEIRKIVKLLEKAAKSSSGDIRAHYESLLYQIDNSLYGPAKK